MKIISTVAQIESLLEEISKDQTIGFVPTMGALHEGHLSLIDRAKEEANICVCSIFVNPTQFNNTKDLNNYPHQLSEDLKLLEEKGCDVVFTPTKSEIYPDHYQSKSYNFGTLDKVMEGANRPGHFEGVAMVVSRLFDIVQPQKAFFGEKDYQQLAIIRSLVQQDHRPIQIIPCPIEREKDGLAMSSRNLRLNKAQRKAAARIYERISMVPELQKSHSIESVIKWIQDAFKDDADLKLEYFEISHAQSLEKSKKWADSAKHIACIAVYAGAIRLIDNILVEIN